MRLLISVDVDVDVARASLPAATRAEKVSRGEVGGTRGSGERNSCVDSVALSRIVGMRDISAKSSKGVFKGVFRRVRINNEPDEEKGEETAKKGTTPVR